MPPRFTPAAWLPHAHLQTVYGSLFAKAPHVAFRRERWETPDGDFVDVDFAGGHEEAPWVHLFHGLEGSAQSPNIRALVSEILAKGWRASVLHFRGCSGEPNRLPRAYHSGDSHEIDWVLRRLRERLPGTRFYAAGVSLGGNALAKWLGEQADAAKDVVDAAAVMCAPLDLTAAGDALERGFAMAYTKHFLGTLKKTALAKLERFPGIFDGEKVRASRTLRDFDNVVTAPLHGFRDTDDYWTRASSKPWLASIRVPTLILNARDDPFLPESALPSRDEVSAAVTLEFPDRGGHVGFVSGPFPGRIDWLPRRVVHFFEHRE